MVKQKIDEKIKLYVQSLQILTVYATETDICIEQLPVHDKTNEIPIVQENGCIIKFKRCNSYNGYTTLSNKYSRKIK